MIDEIYEELAKQHKREEFAKAALTGIMANPNCNPVDEVHYANIAEDAVTVADYLIALLEEKQ